MPASEKGYFRHLGYTQSPEQKARHFARDIVANAAAIALAKPERDERTREGRDRRLKRKTQGSPMLPKARRDCSKCESGLCKKRDNACRIERHG